MNHPVPDRLPGVHEHLLDYYVGYDYRRCKVDKAREALSYGPENICGHAQRSFSTWWALHMAGPLDLGLDIGSHRGLTPYCIHVDRYYTNEGPHPFYGGGPAGCDVIADGGKPLGLFCPNTYPIIVSNHSLEHMDVPGDRGLVDLLKVWHGLLRVGGVIAAIVPDHSWNDTLAMDRDHKHAPCSKPWNFRKQPGPSFRQSVLDPLCAETGAEIVEYDTLDNRFSFNFVVRRTR